ncbi:hypothetical protein [Mameliella alba]|uniref:hypothetical protein n=1 Tax=Mameliella alba TaxID=561184 RepID=UPI0014312884|nr:hypothetical protein [Mameliella alba]
MSFFDQNVPDAEDTFFGKATDKKKNQARRKRIEWRQRKWREANKLRAVMTADEIAAENARLEREKLAMLAEMEGKKDAA